MSYFNPEPPYKHGDPPKIGIILANLGTPDAADAPSLRKYLGQFLMDRRVRDSKIHLVLDFTFYYFSFSTQCFCKKICSSMDF